jgi:hypothetical protein
MASEIKKLIAINLSMGRKNRPKDRHWILGKKSAADYDTEESKNQDLAVLIV